MSGESNAPKGAVWEPAQIDDPERDRQIADLQSKSDDLQSKSDELQSKSDVLQSQNDELTDKVAQLMFENAKLNRGKKSKARPPSTATEAFSALALVLLRRGVAEAQLLEDLTAAYRLDHIPNVARQAQLALALAKRRQAE